MYLVAVTTAELDQHTTWVYLHPADGRMQLSPYPMDSFIPDRDDALKALALAQDFYGAGDSAHFISLDGPETWERSSYRGPAHLRDSLVERHRGNLSMAGYLTEAR